MTPEQKESIQIDAEHAARSGKTPNERCPHPFSSDQGKWWVECYWNDRDNRRDAGQALGGCGWETAERRG